MADLVLDCFNYRNLIDLGFTGSKYPWTNKRRIGDTILERQDRIVANYAWLDLYPEEHVHYLPRTHSDHSPLYYPLTTPFIKKVIYLDLKQCGFSIMNFLT